MFCQHEDDDKNSKLTLILDHNLAFFDVASIDVLI